MSTQVLIAEKDEEIITQASQAVALANDLALKGVVRQAAEAWSIMLEDPPDLVLVAVGEPGLDGLEILQLAASKSIKAIVLLSDDDELLCQHCLELGACYYLLKPIDINFLLRRIRQVSQETPALRPLVLYHPSTQRSLEIEQFLDQVGFPRAFKGYGYLCDALLMVLEDEKYLDGITKRLYPYIAEKYQTTAMVVERAIRNAIEHTWDHGDFEYLYDLFGTTISSKKGKPTNSAFIARVVQLLSSGSRAL